jgi:hypothetical protein
MAGPLIPPTESTTTSASADAPVLFLPGGVAVQAPPPSSLPPNRFRRSDQRPARSALPVLLAFMALAGVCFGETVHYAVGLNDFWYLNFLGLQVDPGNLATWRNGFYPWGTALLYALFAPCKPLVSMTYLSLTMAMVCVTTMHISARRLAGIRTANAASVVLLLSPWFMVYAVTQTPDMLTMTLLTLGVALLLVSKRPHMTQLVGAALALGLAGALRAHTALITLPLMLALAYYDEPRRMRWTLLLAVVAAFPMFQTVVNLAAGYPPFHTAQTFNLYKAIHGVEWLYVSNIRLTVTPLELIADAPWTFFRNVGLAMFGQAVLATPVFFGTTRLVAIDPERAPVWRALRAASIAYVSLSALGDSTRAGLLILPGSVLALAALVAPHENAPWMVYERPKEKPSRLTPFFLWGIAGALSIVAVGHVSWEWNRRGATFERNLAVQEHLRTLGELPDRADAIWSNDFDLWIPAVAPFRTRHNGGWARVDLDGFDSASPELCLENAACLHATALATGITVVAWCSLGDRLPGALQNELAQDPAVLSTFGLLSLGRSRDCLLFQVAVPGESGADTSTAP